MQKLIDELNLTQYKSVEQVVRIYTFFKTKELNVQIQFTFDDFYQCLVLKLNSKFSQIMKTFLIEYLVCLYLEVHLNDIHHPYIQLLINQNRCVRQCLIFNEMANILRFLIDHHKIAEPIDIPDEHFHDLDFDTKIEILILYKWFNGVIQNKIQLFQKGIVKEKKQESKKQWQEELHELYGQQDEIISEERKILSRKQLAISNKKRIKEIEKEKEQIDERIIKLNNLIDIDIKELQKFGVNSMKILLRDQDYCVWIIQAMPNYVLIKINKKFNLLYGEEIHKLINKIDDGPLKECLVLESEEFCNEKRVQSKSKDIEFQLDQTGLHQFKKQEGKPEYLIFCQDVNNLDEILIKMILEIEEKSHYSFANIYSQIGHIQRVGMSGEKKSRREYTRFHLYIFKSRFYEFDNDDEVPDDYKDKKIPLFYYYKNLSQDLQEVQNCDYAYVLILYCRVLVQQNRNIERQKEKLVELAEQAEQQEINNIKSQQKSIQPVKPKRAQRAIIDDDDDDEDFNLNSYYYR